MACHTVCEIHFCGGYLSAATPVSGGQRSVRPVSSGRRGLLGLGRHSNLVSNGLQDFKVNFKIKPDNQLDKTKKCEQIVLVRSGNIWGDNYFIRSIFISTLNFYYMEKKIYWLYRCY